MQLVILDTPPTADQTGARAAKASDLVLVPTRPDLIDLDAVSASIETAGTTPAAVVLSAVPSGHPSGDEAAAALTGAGLPLCPVRVFRRQAWPNAFNEAKGVVEWEPRGKAAGEVVELWEWICGRLGMSVKQIEGETV
ncbi:ParA family protein [Belnapia moabensis]|uniref:ParA family protein n=1 Tax=Belnapia moabensis TaxID=365533 RepID=UPI000694DFEC|nr:ParA family protein [Belnapia moabensis]